MQIDLHCHSTISDGLFSPRDLVAHAAAQGVDVLALTDHDGTGGLAEARSAADELGVAFIDGTEISVSWRGRTIHIVGLCIDPRHPELVAGLQAVRGSRLQRAAAIAQSLAKAGVKNALEGAQRHAHNPEMIGRTHFARFLVEAGYAPDVKRVFKRYLVNGKPGYVAHEWARLSDAVGWITASGGVAVLAHPGRYDLGKDLMHSLIQEFRQAGGRAIEVVTGSHTPQQYAIFAAYAQQYDLLASCGSDYHGPQESYLDMGRLAPLPEGCTPVWADWPVAAAA